MATIDPNNPIRIPAGGSSNDGTGIPLRDAFISINNEFDALDTDVISLNAHAADTSNPHNVTAAQVGVNDSAVNITTSGALGGGGSFTLNKGTASSISISHNTKSVTSSQDGSPTNVITSITFDSYGHVNSYQYTPAADLGGGGGGGVTVDSYTNFSLASDGTLFVTYNDNNNSFIKSSIYGLGNINGYSYSYTSALPLKTAIFYDSSLAVPFQASSISNFNQDGTLGFDNATSSLTYFSRKKYQDDGFTGTGWYEVGGGGGGDSFTTLLTNANYFDSIDLSSNDTANVFTNVTTTAYTPTFYSNVLNGFGGVCFLNDAMNATSNGYNVQGGYNLLYSPIDNSNNPSFNAAPSIFGATNGANGSLEYNQNISITADIGGGYGLSNINWSNATSKQLNKNVTIGVSNFHQFNYDSVYLRNNVLIGERNFASASYGPYFGNVQDNVLIGTNNLSGFFCNRENGFSKLVCIGSNNLNFGSDFSANATAYSTIVIGNYNSSNNLENVVILGNQTFVNGDNEFQLGNTSNTVYTSQAIQTRSDERDKTAIRDTQFGLDFVNRLRPVDFKWDFRSDYWYQEEYTEDVLDAEGNPVLDDDGNIKTVTKQRLVKPDRDGSKARNRYHCGLLAQEVKQTLTDLGMDFGVLHDASVNGGEDVLTLGYTELVGPLIKAVQELSARVAQLENA